MESTYLQACLRQTCITGTLWQASQVQLHLHHADRAEVDVVMPQAALMPSTQSGGLEFLEQLGFATTASVTAQALKQQARYKVGPAWSLLGH